MPRLPRSVRSGIPLILVLVAGVIAGTWLGRKSTDKQAANAVSSAPPEAIAAASASSSTIKFDSAKQAAAGVRVAPVLRRTSNDAIRVTGKIAVDEDRLAHVYSIVEGVLRKADVKLGDDVKAGQELALVDSREVGQIKLDLARRRLEVGFAKTNFQWADTIHKNTQSMIAELLKNPPVPELEDRFRSQPMGDNRHLLVAAYATLQKTQADYNRLNTLREQNVGVEKDFIRAKADFESAAAAYQALLEQLRFTTKQSLLEADQKLQEALTGERMSRAQLLILGYTEKAVDALDPLSEGAAVAHYSIQAPFNGTITAKHAVLSEQVGPQHQLFELADLSRVWLNADVFEKDLSTLDHVVDKRVKFHAAGYPGREFTAEIAHTGSAVDEKTRAIRVVAVAENPDRVLRPGMFVEVLLPLPAERPTIVIPSSAVLGSGADAYVFVEKAPAEFERRSVRLGRTVDEHVQIESGLSDGERVVVAGAFALKSELLKELLAE